MQPVEYDGRVVLVTGAGRGLGRAYARLLARRGARVLVNDLGSKMTGEGSDPSAAAGVVREIIDAGGDAVADHGDVSDPAAAATMVELALDRFGRLDAVINNAGIIATDSVTELTVESLRRNLDVHLIGSWNVTRAAWPELVRTGGAVVMTTSAALFGSDRFLAYSTAKGAVYGLMRSLARAGAAEGVRVNAVMPAAETRMQGTAADAVGAGALRATDPVAGPENAAAVACYLVHSDCTANGETFMTGRGRAAAVVLASGEPLREAETWTLERVAGALDTLSATTAWQVETSLEDYRSRVVG